MPTPGLTTPDPEAVGEATATPDGSPGTADDSDLASGTSDDSGGSGVPLAVGVVVAFIAVGSGVGLFLARRRGL